MSDIKATGALFTNDKRGNDKAPDYRGDFKITQELLDALAVAFGTGHDKVQLAGWKKVGQKGTYLSLSVQPPFQGGREQQGAADSQSRPAARPSRDLDSDIPF